MKPLFVQFKCFGPYMEKQRVDFTELEQSGLFLICGETGAGKTTILDAMCVALYGKSSGGTRGGLSDMRCKLAGRDDVTETELVFENGGRRYRFTRGLRVARKNETEKHQCMELRGGQWVPFFENPTKTAVSAKAEEIIGLSYEQFRQVIVLPQGQFERLLTSDSRDKEEILTSLFHTERLERVVEEVCRRVKERDGALKQESEAIAAELKKHSCDSLEELAEKANREARALTETRAETEKADRELDGAKRAHAAALLENREFADLAGLERKLDGLREKQAGFDRDEELLCLADAADQLKPVYLACEAAKTRKTAAEKKLEAADAGLAGAADALKAAQSGLAAQEKTRPVYEEQKKRVILLENAHPAYQSLAEKKAIADGQLVLYRKAVEAKRKADRRFEQANAAWEAALEAQSRARTAHQEAQKVYLRGIGGVLARRLQPGEPCPVCGSTDHPSPAEFTENHISDGELDELAQAENSANDAEVTTRSVRKEAEGEKNSAADALYRAERKKIEAQTEYKRAEAGKLDGIDTEAELDAGLAALKKAIAAFDAAEAATREAVNTAQSAKQLAEAEVTRLTGELEAVRKDCESKETAWREALGNSPLADEARFSEACMEPEEKQRKKDACARFQAELRAARDAVAEKREALKDKAAPNLDAVKQRMDAAEKAAGELKTSTALLEKELETLESDCKRLTERKRKHDAERLAADEDLEFAAKLRGRSGVSLQRYVLGVKLSAITAAANRLLETVYGGRYRLYRTDGVAGRGQKAGLELEVFDTAQNQRRSVTTLSGGEKFLVALSLAIGLSTVVQASGGVHMEAMFVDEGFGSLDDNAVDDAIGILRGIQRNAGMVVGVISHVGRLEETIFSRLEVKKGGSGSTIRVHS